MFRFVGPRSLGRAGCLLYPEYTGQTNRNTAAATASASDIAVSLVFMPVTPP